MPKTLYFGGSFNPIANHHLYIAKLAMERNGYDRVCFIPCFDAPHKSNLVATEGFNMGFVGYYNIPEKSLTFWE